MSKYVMLAKCSLCGETIELSQEFQTEEQVEWYVSQIYRTALRKGWYKPAVHRCKDGNLGLFEPVGFIKQESE